jgi:hypothetical protein
MSRHLSDLLETIDGAFEGRTTPTGVVPPWLGWLVVALLRQRERQAWHRFIVSTRLGEDERALNEGPVPRLPGWSFYFHGIGCCLTGPDGELVDVDRRDEAAAIIDPYFFAWRVRSVRELRFPEMRLWRWTQNEEMIIASLGELRAIGALAYPEGDHLFCLAQPLEERVGLLRGCAFDDAASNSRWQSALGDTDAPETLEAHRRWVRAHASNNGTGLPEPARSVLEARDVFEVCIHHLAGKPGPVAGTALNTLRSCASDASPAVSALLQRLSPTDDPPYPAYEALAYLLERGVHDSEVLRRFRAFAGVERAAGFLGNPFLAEYAVLALRFLPDLAMDLIRRSLRSSTPLCVDKMAALLAVIDQPWCTRELVVALQELPGSSSIAEALRRNGSERAQRQAARLYRPPTHDPSCLGYTWAEVAHNAAPDMLDGRMETVLSLAEELRQQYPPTWEG